MAKTEITKTELVWPGKYNEDGTLREVPRVSLPFQVIETVNESRATREAQTTKGLSLFDVYKGTEGDSFEAGWRNKLIWGDNLPVMSSLLEKFAGKLDLIFIDPPFATGADFSFVAEIGDKAIEVDKEQSVIEEKAYRDTWGKYGPGREMDSYLEMLQPRLALMRELLNPRGSLYVHCDWRVVSAFRLVLDEVFGGACFRNIIAWHYRRFSRRSSDGYPAMYDSILFYGKSQGNIFSPQPDEVRPRGTSADTTRLLMVGSVSYWSMTRRSSRLRSSTCLSTTRS